MMLNGSLGIFSGVSVASGINYPKVYTIGCGFTDHFRFLISNVLLSTPSGPLISIP